MVNPYRLFLDANVLFTAAHNPAGKAALVSRLAKEGYWEVLTSRLAIEEARRNLEIKYPLALDDLETILTTVQLTPAPFDSTCPIDLPKKDQPIFAAALACRASHLLTGDRKHFGSYFNQPGLSAGIVIQTVADFLEKTKHPARE